MKKSSTGNQQIAMEKGGKPQQQQPQVTFQTPDTGIGIGKKESFPTPQGSGCNYVVNGNHICDGGDKPFVMSSSSSSVGSVTSASGINMGGGSMAGIKNGFNFGEVDSEMNKRLSLSSSTASSTSSTTTSSSTTSSSNFSEYECPMENRVVFIVSSKFTNLLDSISIRDYLYYKSTKEYINEKRSRQPDKIVILDIENSIADGINLLMENGIMSAPVVEVELDEMESTNTTLNTTSGSSSSVNTTSTDTKQKSGGKGHIHHMRHHFNSHHHHHHHHHHPINIIRKTEDHKQQRYQLRGILDILDIIMLLQSVTQRNTSISGSLSTSASSSSSPTQFNMATFLQQPLKQALNFLSLEDQTIIKDNMTLLRVTECLLLQSSPFKTHRLFVFEKASGNIIGNISQKDILYFTQRNLDMISPDIGNKTPKQLKLLRPVITVSSDSKLGEALPLLGANRINGVAIVDPSNGKLVSLLTYTDMRNVDFQNLEFFNQPLLSFIKSVNNGVVKYPITFTQLHKYTDVINLMCDNNVMSVYMVDDHGVPLACVCLSDIIRVLPNC